MAVKKHTYINTDKDGFIKENRSPLSPPWMLSGLQNKGKVLVGGEDGFVEWGLGSGGSGGTTNYELLENKPKINGIELIGNVAINYIKNADITPDGKTLVLTKENGEVFNFTPHENETYTKAEIDAKINEVINQVIYSHYTKQQIDEKLSNNNLYLKLKDILLQGSYIQLDKNDLSKTITINQTEQPIPEHPISGIYCYGAQYNEWIQLDPATVFNASDDIEGQGMTTGRYYTFPRQIFNEQVYVKSNVPVGPNFLANCPMYNKPIDLSETLWTFTGAGFLYGCKSFNNKLKFNNLIATIGDDFMVHCEAFDQQIVSLFTPNLAIIGKSFMSDCYSFKKVIDLTFCTSLQRVSTSFMYNCKNMDKGSLIIIRDDIYKFGADDLQAAALSFATNDQNADVYKNGFKIIGISKQVFDAAHDGAFADRNNSPYRKTICTES